MRSPLASTQVSGYSFRERTDQNSGLPGSDGVKYHIGIDLVANVGTPFYAPEAGTIINVWSGRQNVPGGNIVELQGTYTHRFLHLNEIHVSRGQQVSEGQQLGTTGNSGGVGAHLHFDTRNNNTAWNASLYNYVDWTAMLKSNQGDQMADANDVRAIYQYGPLGREGDAGGVNHYVGKKTDAILADHANSQEGKARKQYVANLEQSLRDTQASVAGMQAKIAELSLNPTKADYALVQAELNDKLTKLSATQTALDVERLNIKTKEIYVENPATQHKLDKIINYLKVLPLWIGKLLKRNK